MWQIDIEVDDDETEADACEQAWAMVRDPHSSATVLDVVGGNSYDMEWSPPEPLR
jgi:hypothetical protein